MRVAMFQRSVLTARSQTFLLRQVARRRFLSSVPPSPREAPSARTAEKVEKLQSRVPRFLRPYTTSLTNAPVSTVLSFLLIHELTAIVPLIGLTYYFHATHTIPAYALAHADTLAKQIDRLGAYFKRKGWRTFRGDEGARLILEAAAAYLLVKAFLIPRLVLSGVLAPLGARFIVIPLMSIGRRMAGRVVRLGRSKKS